MRKVHKILVFGLLVLAAAISLIKTVNKVARDDEWHVLMMALPEEISTEVSDVSIVSYILAQTHKTVFKKSSNGLFVSEVLTDWNLSSDGKIAKFCVDGRIEFSANRNFSTSDLKNAIANAIDKVPQSITQVGADCIEYSFSTPSFDLIEALSHIKNAPTIRIQNSKFESGLGKFLIESLSGNEVVLRRKVKENKSINVIRIFKYHGPGSFVSEANERLIDDPNRVSFDLIPAEIKESYKTFKFTQLQSGVLIINVRDIATRKRIYNCIDIPKLISAFAPDLVDRIFIQTLLPVGVPGGIEGIADQKCKDVAGQRYKNVTFFNWKLPVQSRIETYFRDLQSQMGFPINVSQIDNSLLMKIATNKYEGDFISIFGLDSISAAPIDFYSGLIERHSHLPAIQNPKLFQLFEKLKSIPRDAQNEVLNQIEKEIRATAIILPLYQPLRTFYYPKNIEGVVNSVDHSLLTPDISKIRL